MDKTFKQNELEKTNDIIIQDIKEPTNDFASTNLITQENLEPTKKTPVDFSSFKAPPRKPKNVEISAINLLSLKSDSIIQNTNNTVVKVSSNLSSEPKEKFSLANHKSEIKNSVTRRDKMKTVNNWLLQINNETDEIKKIEPPKKRKLPEIQSQIVSDENGRMCYGKKSHSKNEPIIESNSEERFNNNLKLKYIIETVNGNAYNNLSEKIKIHQPEEICFTILFKYILIIFLHILKVFNNKSLI